METLLFKETNNDTSQFYYQKDFLTENETNLILSWLKSLTDFRINPSFNKDKIARYQKWFQEEQTYFCPKWTGEFKRWEAFKYTKELYQIQELIVKKLNNLNLEDLGINIPKINSCLVNKYTSGKQYIRPHRDTDLAFGKEPVIIGISLGSTRTIEFKRLLYNGSNRLLSKRDKLNSHLDFSFKLENASLFIMSGSSQKYWSHEIPPCENADIRYSLTFRKHIA